MLRTQHLITAKGHTSGHPRLHVGKVTLQGLDVVTQGLQRRGVFDKATVSRAVFHEHEQKANVSCSQIPLLRQYSAIFEEKTRPGGVKQIGCRRRQSLFHFTEEGRKKGHVQRLSLRG